MTLHVGDFYTGAFMTPTLILFAALAVALTTAATILHRCGLLVLSPRQQTAARVSIKASLVGSCLVIGAARFFDLRAKGHNAPGIPAVATAASWAAALALVPVPKAMNPGRLFGCGYERTIPYHTFVGTFTMVAGTVHGVWCIIGKELWRNADFLSPVHEGALDSSSWWSKFCESNLAGVLTFLSFISLIISSRNAIRRKAFATWRALHFTFTGTAYFFLVVHDPNTMALLLPIITFLIVDVILRVVISVLANGRVVDVVAHPDASIVEIKVKIYGLLPGLLSSSSISTARNTVDDTAIASHDSSRVTELLETSSPTDIVGTDGSGIAEKKNESVMQRVLGTIGRVLLPHLTAGDFVHLGILAPQHPRLWAPHPLTVASYDREERTAVFFVKGLGPWSQQALDSAIDESLVVQSDEIIVPLASASGICSQTRAHGHDDPRLDDDCLVDQKRLGHRRRSAGGSSSSSSSLIGARVSWVGPCGSLQVPLESVPNHLLVCGGVGVTPMISILEALAQIKNKKKKNEDNARDAKDAATAQTTANAVASGAEGRALLVWCVRGPALPRALWPTLSRAASGAGAEIRIFDTSAPLPSDGIEHDHQAPHDVAIDNTTTFTATNTTRERRETANNALDAGLTVSETPVQRAEQPLLSEPNLPVSSYGAVPAGRSDSRDHAEETEATAKQENDAHAVTVGIFGDASGSVNQHLAAVTVSGRPDLHRIMGGDFTFSQVHANRNDTGSVVEGDHASPPAVDQAMGGDKGSSVDDSAAQPPLGVYCCGPRGMALQCFAAATARGATWVHNEQF